MNNHHQQALETAKMLHQQRQHYAQELGQLITESMHALSMPHGVFCIDVKFEEHHLSADGADRVEFKVTTNPVSRYSQLRKSLPAGNCHVLRWLFRSLQHVRWKRLR